MNNSKYQIRSRSLLGEVNNDKVTDNGGMGKRKWSGYGGEGGGDDGKTGPKGENRRKVHFSDDVAYQCEYDDDEDDFFSDSDLEDDLFKSTNGTEKASELSYVKEEEMGSEEFIRIMENRYQLYKASGVVIQNKDCPNQKNYIDRDTFVPSAKLPTMLEFKCKGNVKGANSSKLSTGNVKSVKSRDRVWTVQEEETLINALKELVALGWKCGNGFRTGYLLCLENALVTAFPSTDLRAEPHMRSKIQAWEEWYDSLYEMLWRPGFTWNCQTKMISVDKGKTWRDYVKSNPFAKNMRYKTWPYYHHWCEIFGKDRATSDKIKDSNAADKDQSEGNYARSERNTNDVPPVGEKGFTPVCQRSSNLTGNEPNSKREESTVSTSATLVELMGAFCEATKSSFTELTKKMSVDYDMRTQRKTVYEALGGMGQLSVAQKVHVAKLLVNNSNELDLFFSLPHKAKVEMVRQLIGEPCLMFSKF